ncbi:MAG: trypsin-like serine protease [Deltaproteobacteria bacterium]|nr:trypsin-like serine protease [Deltaproteobacteria bacterium]
MSKRFASLAGGFLLWTALSGACAPDATTDLARRSSAIYYGERENGYEGVVMLQVSLGGAAGALCTGTVVAARVVVTAKHCVVDDRGTTIDPEDVIVGTGPTGTRDYYDVEDVRTTGGTQVEGRDFAVLITTDEIDEEPYPYVTDWDPEEGQPITLVGYGQRDDGQAGRKYLGENEVDYVFRSYFTTVGESACYGDSGGPAFDADGALVGVIVNTLGGWGGGEPCEDGVSGITRVDYWADIIDEAIEDAWICDGLDEEICGDERDNDCDRIIDNGCLELGDPCTDSVFCGSGDCRDLGDGARCTSTCDLDAAECLDGFYCASVACGEGACLTGEAGDLSIGSACEDDTECENLSCIEAGGSRRCLRRCSADGDCGQGEACGKAKDADCGGCVGSGDASPFGAPCSVAEDCASAVCAVDAFGAFCSAACPPDCPEGLQCGVAGQCVRPYEDGEVGDPCASNDDCSSELCGNFDAGRTCTDNCDPANPCPGGFSCNEHDGTSFCEPGLPPVGSACSGNDDCQTGLCGHFGEFDACTQPCSADDPCPVGLMCVEAGAAERYCRPENAPPVEEASDERGCSCGLRPRPRGLEAVAWMMLAVLGAFGRRFRS